MVPRIQPSAVTPGPGTLVARLLFQGVERYAIRVSDGFELCDGIRFDSLVRSGMRCRDSEVELLPPVKPTKVLGIGANYTGDPEAARLVNPSVFIMPPSAITASRKPIVLGPTFGSALAEGELAVVIGRRARAVDEEEALEYVFGYTIANDVSGREPRQEGITPAFKKGSDTFLPLGPFLLVRDERHDFTIETRVNDEVQQQGSTMQLIFSVARCIAYISRGITLEPGDVIVTGTPPPKPTVRGGDIVSVKIEGIGTLTNEVVA